MPIHLKSKYVIIGIIIFFIFLLINYTYSISDKIVQTPIPSSKIWYLGKGDYFKDSLLQKYSHLVADFPLLELDPHSNHLIETEGYSNSKRFLTLDLRNDTLFVLQSYPNSDTVLVASEGDYPIIVRVGAESLQSITIKKGGHIDIPARPYGSNPDGEIVYKPHEWKKYLIIKDELKIILEDNGYLKMFADIGILNISYKKKSSGTFNIFKSEILGAVENLSIIDPQGHVYLEAPSLICDSLIVHSSPDSPFGDRGIVITKVETYLEAELLHDLDIAYKGEPVINKSEKSRGRVIDNN